MSKRLKRWGSKDGDRIAAAVIRAGGELARTKRGHMKVYGPAGITVVAPRPGNSRWGNTNTLNVITQIRRVPLCRSGARTQIAHNGGGPLPHHR
jgi:hypothetical protein